MCVAAAAAAAGVSFVFTIHHPSSALPPFASTSASLLTEGLSWDGVTSCSCCTVALAVCLAAVGLGICNINWK